MQTQETVIHLKVPPLPESVSDATVLTWHKKAGDTAKRDETLVDLETDKVVIEVPAPADGILKEILQLPGTQVNTDQVLGIFQPSAIPVISTLNDNIQPEIIPESKSAKSLSPLSPATRRLLGEHDIQPDRIIGTGKAGRITPEDIKATLKTNLQANLQANSAELQNNNNHLNNTPAPAPAPSTLTSRPEQRITMSRLRKRIAERLLSVQQNAAILTTFNEVNLQLIMDLRQRYKDQFEKTHQVRLGFMSFFTQAVVKALQRFPAVNASIDGEDIVYHGYYDIGVAVSSERGLVVPVLRDADKMSLADIEKKIATYGKRARDNQLTLEEITGGTFTITNGGVFGSLLSTPILNPPQSAILGMHKIQERPMAENGQIVIRPMMYLALSYDHRIIDGKESVKFLATIKELLEDPARILLEI